MNSWKDVVIHFFAAVKYIAILLILIFIAYIAKENSHGLITIPILDSSPARRLTVEEEKCLVAAIHADARQADDSDSAVRQEIARTVIRYAQEFRRDICDVFTDGLTLVPQGYSRPTLLGMPIFWGRRVPYVQNVEASNASWNSDLLLVRDLARPVEGCATHYIRAPRVTDRFSQPESARELMRREMRSVGHARADGKEVGAAEFFCPK